MQNIYRKNNLARNLNKMRKALPDVYDFYPMTWTLPLEKKDFYTEFKKRKRNLEIHGNSNRESRNGNRSERGKNGRGKPGRLIAKIRGRGTGYSS